MEHAILVRTPEEYCAYLEGQIRFLEIEVLELRKCCHGECVHSGDPEHSEQPVGMLPTEPEEPPSEPAAEPHEEEQHGAEEELTEAVEELTEAVEHLTDEVERDVEADEHLADEVEEEGTSSAEEVPVDDTPTHEVHEPAPPRPRHTHPLRRR